MGHYSERIKADKIYRNRNNFVYCRGHGIRLNGLFHGRQKKNDEIDKKTEYKDNAVRIAVERAIILAKQK
ncbi:transposase [Holdemanella sp.]|uniref:transposase n=1 Tax=Holdemanella sp. TaxID=1971762 RepID=UPI003AF19143